MTASVLLPTSKMVGASSSRGVATRLKPFRDRVVNSPRSGVMQFSMEKSFAWIEAS